jgi:methyl-accepting chemotaxis protein
MRMRKRLLVDRKVQGSLMLRAVEYWFCCLATVGLALLAWKLITGPDQPLYQFFFDAWRFFLPTAVVSVLILPLLVYDILRLSNKFTGPLFRLRRELRRLAAGENVPPIRFRSGDFWPEMADEFNAVAQRLEMLANRAETARKTTEQSHRTVGQTTGVQENLRLGQLGAEERANANFSGSSSAKTLVEDYPLRERLGDLPRADRKLAEF